MKTGKELTQERLQYLLSYNPDTGEFTRLVRRGRCPAGEIAGYPSRKSSGQFYVKIRIDGKKYYAHRLAWLYTYGDWPKDQIDHLYQDSLNNRLINLREVTNAENLKNRKRQNNNRSGVTGVHFHNKAQKWEAYITVNFKRIYLGHFDLKDDAIVARKNAEVEYGFHPNHGR